MNLFDELRNKEIKLLRHLNIEIYDCEYDLQSVTDVYVKVNNYVCNHREVEPVKPYKALDSRLEKLMYHQWLVEGAARLEKEIIDHERPGKDRYKWIDGWIDSPCYDSGIVPARKTKVEHYRIKDKEIISVVFTLGRKYIYGAGEGNITYPLDRRVQAFYNFLSASLLSSERLICKNKSFRISSPRYEISYYLEAYKEEINKCGYIEGDKLVIEKLDRPSVGDVYKELRALAGKNSTAIEEVFRTMQKEKYVAMYPNAARRFVILCEKKIEEILEYNENAARIEFYTEDLSEKYGWV